MQFEYDAPREHIVLVFDGSDEDPSDLTAVLSAKNVPFTNRGSDGITTILIHKDHWDKFQQLVEATFWLLARIRDYL